MPAFDHFGWIAPFYDRIFAPGDRSILFEMLDLPVSGWLLDAGGGTGRIAQLLGEQAHRVLVADLSFEMVYQANIKGGLLTCCSTSENFPFISNWFDRVVMVDALHHVWDQAETARDLWRVLKPGGRLIIEEPDVRKFGVKVLAMLEKMFGMRSRFLSPPQIAELFGDQGVTKILTQGAIAWVSIDKPSD